MKVFHLPFLHVDLIHPFCTVDVVPPRGTKCEYTSVRAVQAMALRSLATREEILADLSAAGEPFTPQVIERYRLAAGVAGGFACVRVCRSAKSAWTCLFFITQGWAA